MLPDIMEHILEGLNSHFECRIPIREFQEGDMSLATNNKTHACHTLGLQNEDDNISANTIDLKLFPRYPDPPPVYDYQVPVLIIDLVQIMEHEAPMDTYWDLTLQKIIPRIDGVAHVKMISDLADVSIELVRLAVQHLL